MNANASIDENMLVADVLARWPQVVPVFWKHRMYCLGCCMARFDTLSDAAQVYGLCLERLLEELQDVAAQAHSEA